MLGCFMPDAPSGGVATWLQAISIMIAAASAVYSFGSWRRQLIGSKKAEVAEKLLACCYEARDIIDAARFPVSLDNEGKERPYSVGETATQERLFNRYWVPTERLRNKDELFAKLAAAQYSARTYLGESVTQPVNLIINKRNEILSSARMLVLQSEQLLEASELSAQRQKWRRIIWSMDEKDELKNDIEAAVGQIEAICRPVLEHTSVLGLIWQRIIREFRSRFSRNRPTERNHP
jgi:hypothetical protein